MKKRNRVDVFRKPATGARNEYGNESRPPQLVDGHAGIPCGLVNLSLGLVTGGLQEAAYGLVPAGRWVALFNPRGKLPKPGDYLLAAEYGGPRRFMVRAVTPVGGRFDTVAQLDESAEAFGPP